MREPLALVAFVPNRVGLLIPLGERWMLRPDFAGGTAKNIYWDQEWAIVAGVSLIRRSRPTDRGWTYAAVRFGISTEQAGSQGPTWVTTHVTATGGGHAQVRAWLGVFGEAGLAASHFDQGDGYNPITEFEIVSRVGITLRRPPREP